VSVLAQRPAASYRLELSAFDAAIVDLDGTMVDTLGDFVVALNLMLAELCPPGVASMQREQVERLVGKGSEHLVNSVLNESQVQLLRPQLAIDKGGNLRYATGQALFDVAFASYQKHYTAINGQHAAVYPGVMDGLRALQQAGLKLACLTNKPLSFARALLVQKGLDGFFSEVFGGDSFARKKPDPLPVLETFKALRTSAARTLMIGDSSNDAIAARAAGCRVVLVTYGYNHGEPIRKVDADAFVDSLAGLVCL
jgi:phosphoglycolate phosphatase